MTSPVVTSESFDGGRLRVARGPASLLRVLLRSRPVTLADVSRTDFAAIVCGPMFDARGVQFLLRGGDTLLNPSRRPGVGHTLAVDPLGVASWHAGAADQGRVAVQGYPTLLSDGAPVEVSDDDGPGTRNALGLWQDGQAFLAFGAGGYLLSGFRNALRAAGARHAVYTDGGRSSQVRFPRWEYKGDGKGAAKVYSFVAFARESSLGTTAGKRLALTALGAAIGGAAAGRRGALWGAGLGFLLGG